MKHGLLTFSDASFNPHDSRACISYLLLHPQGFFTGGTKLIRANSSNSAEISGVYWALHQSRLRSAKLPLVLYTDSQAAAIHHNGRDTLSNILWTKGHTDNLFNNLVDRNARARLKEASAHGLPIHHEWPLIIPNSFARHLPLLTESPLTNLQ